MRETVAGPEHVSGRPKPASTQLHFDVREFYINSHTGTIDMKEMDHLDQHRSLPLVTAGKRKTVYECREIGDDAWHFNRHWLVIWAPSLNYDTYAPFCRLAARAWLRTLECNSVREIEYTQIYGETSMDAPLPGQHIPLFEDPVVSTPASCLPCK